MEVDSSSDNAGAGETRIALHPLAIVHMSDQYTRITSGGSPLDKTAPVVGLLFGLNDDNGTTEVLDADDIPVEISEASTLQVNLHTTVFPKHKVVGWYRVVGQTSASEDIEPSAEDLQITQVLKEHYALNDFFSFCLLKVQSKQNTMDDDEMKMEETNTSTLNKELPIHLYQLGNYENHAILLNIANWQLETSPAERLSVERVMKEKPVGSNEVMYVTETKAMQHSLLSMRERVQVLVVYLKNVQEGRIPVCYDILRQIQQIVSSLGPLSKLAETSSNEGEEEDVELLAHLAIVGRTVNTIQAYTEKFRVINESRNNSGGSISTNSGFEQRHPQSYF